MTAVLHPHLPLFCFQVFHLLRKSACFSNITSITSDLSICYQGHNTNPTCQQSINISKWDMKEEEGMRPFLRLRKVEEVRDDKGSGGGLLTTLVSSRPLQPIYVGKDQPSSQSHACFFSEGEQHWDKPVNIQPLAIIWQPFLACTLSALLTPGHWGQLNRLASPLLLHDPVTCWKRQNTKKQQDVMLLWACFELLKMTNAVQVLTCSSCCQICYNLQMQ